MELHVLGSSSKGNCYLLRGVAETLILEAGIRFSEVKQALDFDLSQVVGCLVTHEHGDHAKYIDQVIKSGIDVYASEGTFDQFCIANFRSIRVKAKTKFSIGQFEILPFRAIHDAREPLGFLIKHPECGTLLFATDTHYIPYTFPGLTNIMVECNYSLDIANYNIEHGAPKAVRDRVLESHMELETFKEFLQANDTTRLNNVILLHLSDGNSNAKQFKSEVEKIIPGKQVWIADQGLKININQTPF